MCVLFGYQLARSNGRADSKQGTHVKFNPTTTERFLYAKQDQEV